MLPQRAGEGLRLAGRLRLRLLLRLVQGLHRALGPRRGCLCVLRPSADRMRGLGGNELPRFPRLRDDARCATRCFERGESLRLRLGQRPVATVRPLLQCAQLPGLTLPRHRSRLLRV